jgi:dTDP-4-dehydrorhamnose 3,5-epimerase
MTFEPTQLTGVWLIHLEPRQDERGLFVRTACTREFAAHGLNTHWPQANLTRTLHAGTVRGLHWQAEPQPEIKLVRCSHGAIWDVVVDLRPDSPTCGQWQAFRLSADAFRQLYVPGGFAHGFQALTEGAEVSYLMSEFYVPDLARGCRWNDPELAIKWPQPAHSLSPRDQSLPTLRELGIPIKSRSPGAHPADSGV